MKWYSTDKYLPQISTDYLIFTENNSSYVARLETTENPRVWIHCENSGCEKIFGVTHFCIIEPVSKDND